MTLFPKNKSAFTLIELLVVVSIIALLISILLPALSKAKESAKTVVCSANLNQCGMAMIMYADEFGGKSPPDPMIQGEYWFHKLAPYLGDNHLENNAKSKSLSQLKDSPEVLKIIYCPSATKTKQSFDDRSTLMKWGSAKLAWSFWGTEGSYGRNGWVYPDIPASASSDVRGRYYTKINLAKADVPVFGDSVWVNAWPDSVDVPPRDIRLGTQVNESGYGMGRFCMDRHKMKVNIVFADRHVESVALSRLWMLSWHRTFLKKEMDINSYSR